MNVKLVHSTQEGEKLIAYCARVSSSHQDNPNYAKLLRYCVKNRHWSIFEMASMCVEIETSRAIAQQILRHRSFHFQEFSQRYAAVTSFERYEARRQDEKNRQNSVDDMDEMDKLWFDQAQGRVQELATLYYEEALKKGIAKEQARFLLPSAATSKLYMHGTVRDWIHYIDLRSGNGTQKEHCDIALAIRAIFTEEYPNVAAAMWPELFPGLE